MLSLIEFDGLALEEYPETFKGTVPWVVDTLQTAHLEL